MSRHTSLDSLFSADPARNTFAGMLAALDEGLGNLTATLRTTKRWASTLFVLTSDNGAPTPGCGGAQGGQNWPLRGGKCSAWSGGNLVPSFIRGPGVRAGEALIGCLDVVIGCCERRIPYDTGDITTLLT